MKELSVTDSLEGVRELSEQSYSAEIPGFQVHRDFARQAGIIPVMTAVEQGSLDALGETIPFTVLPSYGEPRRYPPHVDSGFRGLAVHRSESRVLGEVQLTHLLDGRQPGRSGAIIFAEGKDLASYSETGIEEECTDVDHGEIHRGDFELGTLTVFSQGNIQGLPPAIHYFRRDGGRKAGLWRRYASSSEDALETPEALADTNQQLKYNIAASELSALKRELAVAESIKGYGAEAFQKYLDDGNTFDLTFEEIETRLVDHPAEKLVHIGIDGKTGMVRYREKSLKERFTEKARDLIGVSR